MSEIFKLLSKINLWKNHKIEIGFQRKIYLDKILSFIGNSLIKVITGQRRTGKSYVLRQIMNELLNNGIDPINIFYLNKEYIEFDEITNHKQLQNLFKEYINTLKPKGKIYIFLDEIQQIDSWEKFVNSYSQNLNNKFEIFISGSNSKMLSGELSTLLSGRYINFEVFPFNFYEFCNYKKNLPLKSSLFEYINFGGLPELYNLSSEETRRYYINSLLNTIMLKDVVQRYRIKDALLLENLFKYISENIGFIISINNIVNHFKSKNIMTNFETISNYLQYLKDSYLIHEVDRYDIRGKNILTSNKKYFINDLSYKHYSSSSFEKNIAGIIENLIFLNLKLSGNKIFVGTLYDKEIDFIVENGNEKFYLQAAYLITNDKTANREFGNLLSIKDNYNKYVISFDDVLIKNFKGIKHISLWNFLYNLDNLKLKA